MNDSHLHWLWQHINNQYKFLVTVYYVLLMNLEYYLFVQLAMYRKLRGQAKILHY